MAEYDENQRDYRFKIKNDIKLEEQFGNVANKMSIVDSNKKKQMLLRSPNSLRKNVKFR